MYQIRTWFRHRKSFRILFDLCQIFLMPFCPKVLVRNISKYFMGKRSWLCNSDMAGPDVRAESENNKIKKAHKKNWTVFTWFSRALKVITAFYKI